MLKETEKAMREILYKNMTSVEKGRRAVTVCEKSESKDCVTRVQRTFIYMVRGEGSGRRELSQPVFHIFKSCDSKTRIERFYFRMKGTLYVIKNDCFLEVDFCHSLRIDITPKLVAHSP